MKKHYRKFFRLLFIPILFTPFITVAQITFQKIYPASVNQNGNDVLPTTDGGYLIAGTTETVNRSDIDILISKTDNMGNILWTKTYGGAKPETPNLILQISAGTYFIVGYSQSFGGGDQDMYLLKINNAGDTLWTKTYGGYGNEDGKEIAATADGNFVIVGASNSVNFSDYNIELIKIDSSGTVLWNQYYGGPNYESARSVKLSLDGGFIIAGKTALSATSVASVYLVKTNSLGNILWTQTYSGPDSYEGKSIVANNDGTYTLCVDDSSGTRDSDVRIMNVSATGAINWNKSYGGTDKDICKMIQPTGNGGYIIAAISRSFGWTNPDMWLLRITSSGDTLWTKHYGGSDHEHCYAARTTPDGGFILVGHTKSYSPNTEIMLVKTNSDGTLLGIDTFTSNDTIFNLYPNPTNGIIQFDLDNDMYPGSILRVSNSLGQILFSEILDHAMGIKVIDLRDQKPGIYFATLVLKNSITTRKFILN